MPTDRSFPRLLVATEFGPQAGGGGGALMRQLLRGYPPEQICWWSCRPEPPGQVPEQRLRKHYLYQVPERLYPRRRLGRLKSLMLELLWVHSAAAHLQSVASFEKPEVLWINVHTWIVPVTSASDLQKKYRSHVSIWDYEHVAARMRLFGYSRVSRWRRGAENLFRNAVSCDVISEPMWKDLAQRTSRRDALVVHSGFEAADLQKLTSTASESPHNTVRIAHAGTIHSPETFRLFIRALDQARRALSAKIEMWFFGGATFVNEPWFDRSWMREHRHLEEEKFYSELARCTWGFLAMHLHDEDPAYDRFSFPNKFGTYLACGLPLLVLGHRESSAVKMLEACRTGIWTDATQSHELSDFLVRELADPRVKYRYRDQITRCAQTEFNMERMRALLWRALGVC